MRKVEEKVVYTLAQIEEKLQEPQHRLIHLCEKGVIRPDFEDASGRGTMRRFSERNLFEFAVALELRRFDLPVAYIAPIIRILRAFEAYAAKKIEVFSLPRSLQEKPAVGLHLIIQDGEKLFFVLKTKGETRYIGGLDLTKTSQASLRSEEPSTEFTTRLEVDLTRIANVGPPRLERRLAD